MQDSGFAVTIDSSKISVYSHSVIPVELSDGWNILSVPLLSPEMTATTLFPTAISPFYLYSSVYIQVNVLENGKGYWAKFNGNQSVTISGTLVNSNDILVYEGWNLIGPFASDVPVSSIATLPPNIIISPFFGFETTYYSALTLIPGKGYWVKTSANGILQLNVNIE